MDLLLELIVQLIVEFCFDALLRRLGKAHLTPTGRLAVVAGLGLAFGLGWGAHLSGGASPPKLLWVSLGLGASSLGLALRTVGAAPSPTSPSALQRQVTPWRWPGERLWSLTVLNATLAIGVLAGFAVG